MTGKGGEAIFTPKSFTAAWNRGQGNTPNSISPLPHLLCITELWGLFHLQQSSWSPSTGNMDIPD